MFFFILRFPPHPFDDDMFPCFAWITAENFSLLLTLTLVMAEAEKEMTQTSKNTIKQQREREENPHYQISSEAKTFYESIASVCYFAFNILWCFGALCVLCNITSSLHRDDFWLGHQQLFFLCFKITGSA